MAYMPSISFYLLKIGAVAIYENWFLDANEMRSRTGSVFTDVMKFPDEEIWERDYHGRRDSHCWCISFLNYLNELNRKEQVNGQT